MFWRSPRSALQCLPKGVIKSLCIFAINESRNAGTYLAGATIQKCSTNCHLRAAGHSQHSLASSCAAQDVEVLELIRDGGMWTVGRADAGACRGLAPLPGARPVQGQGCAPVPGPCGLSSGCSALCGSEIRRARGALPRPVRADKAAAAGHCVALRLGRCTLIASSTSQFLHRCYWPLGAIRVPRLPCSSSQQGAHVRRKM